jgi:capsular polysaccharide transport system permease protein
MTQHHPYADRRIPGSVSLPPPKFATLRTIGALVLREMGSTYGRSPGGYVWAVLSPVGGIILLAMAIGVVVRNPPLGTSFILFYATGYLPFETYSQLSNRIGNALGYSKPLLAYPAVTWLDAVLARFILNVLTQILVFCCVILIIMVVVDTRSLLRVEPILWGMTLASLLGLGVGMVNCAIQGYYPVWERIWGIINRPLFLASGVLFLYEDMPRFAQDILWWNPLLHAGALVRVGFYSTYHAQFVSLAYCFGVALGLIVLGLVMLRKGYLAVLER